MNAAPFAGRGAQKMVGSSADLNQFTNSDSATGFCLQQENNAAWQRRRIATLLPAMFAVAAMRSDGVGINRATSIVSEKINGAPLGQGKRLRASSRTIQRYWYKWRPNWDGSVLQLKYRHVSPYESALQRKLLTIWQADEGARA